MRLKGRKKSYSPGAVTTFQFQSGAVKRKVIIQKYALFTYFNSKVVRLKVNSCDFTLNESNYFNSKVVRLKVVTTGFLHILEIYFNSKVVRLKVTPHTLFVAGRVQFQFQSGAVKRDRKLSIK